MDAVEHTPARCASISRWVSPAATSTGQHMVTSARDRSADRAPASIIVPSCLVRRLSCPLPRLAGIRAMAKDGPMTIGHLRRGQPPAGPDGGPRP